MREQNWTHAARGHLHHMSSVWCCLKLNLVWIKMHIVTLGQPLNKIFKGSVIYMLRGNKIESQNV